MKFSLEIEMDNEAFSENPGRELERILTQAAIKCGRYDYDVLELDETKVRDSNGNTVGMISIQE